MTYVAGKAAFDGDMLFMPDFGTGRADFSGGDVRTLDRSIKKIVLLPDEMIFCMCHIYKSPGRDKVMWQTAAAEEKAKNVPVGARKTADEYATLREAHDAKPEMPALILPSVRVNIRSSQMPHADDNDVSLLKIPIN